MAECGSQSGTLQFEGMLRDISTMAVKFSKSLELAAVHHLCGPSVIARAAQLAHHCSVAVRAELRCMLDAMHWCCGAGGQFLVPRGTCSKQAGSAWLEEFSRALALGGVGLWMPISMCVCMHVYL